MSPPHHTDLQGADELVDRFQARLASDLEALQGKSGARLAATEGVRLALLELVAATRANYPLARCQRVLAGIFGGDAKGPTVRLALEDLQEAALAPRGLPAGVATPVPVAPEDRTTPVRPPPVVALEVDVSEGRPTSPLPPKHPRGPWLDPQPTVPVKPRRKP